MIFTFDERLSDSPFVERIWRTHSECAGSFLSVAMSHWEMVVTRYNGTTTLTVRGPETKATPLDCPADGEWLGIRFKLGTFFPHLPASQLVDGAVNLPNAASRSFWLHGSAWQFPVYENADTFVEQLVRDGLLVREPVVEAALQNQLKDLSVRTAQRHFLRTTGLTHRAVRQIERARYATTLLQQGVSILDVVYEAGYAACFVFARRFAALQQLGWAVYSVATGVIFFAAFFGIASGSQGSGVSVAFAVAVVIAWVWISVMAARLMAGPPGTEV